MAEIGIETPFTSAQWNIMDHITFLLKPVKDIIDTLSAATVALDIIPVVSQLKKKRSKIHQNQILVPKVQAFIT